MPVSEFGLQYTRSAGADEYADPRCPVTPADLRHPLGERLNSRWIYFNPPRVNLASFETR